MMEKARYVDIAPNKSVFEKFVRDMFPDWKISSVKTLSKASQDRSGKYLANLESKKEILRKDPLLDDDRQVVIRERIERVIWSIESSSYSQEILGELVKELSTKKVSDDKIVRELRRSLDAMEGDRYAREQILEIISLIRR